MRLARQGGRQRAQTTLLHSGGQEPRAQGQEQGHRSTTKAQRLRGARSGQVAGALRARGPASLYVPPCPSAPTAPRGQRPEARKGERHARGVDAREQMDASQGSQSAHQGTTGHTRNPASPCPAPPLPCPGRAMFMHPPPRCLTPASYARQTPDAHIFHHPPTPSYLVTPRDPRPPMPPMPLTSLELEPACTPAPAGPEPKLSHVLSPTADSRLSYARAHALLQSLACATVSVPIAQR